MSLHQDLARQQAATACYTDLEGRPMHVFRDLEGRPMHVFRAGERCQCGHLTYEEYQLIGARTWNDGIMFRELEAALPMGTPIQEPLPPEFIVRQVRPDSEAGPADLAWLSAEATGERLAACRAGVVIAPEAVAATAAGVPRCVIISEHPRWLFAELVAKFFAPSMRPDWRGGISPDAVIGPGARIGPGVVIGAGVAIGVNVTIGPNTVLAHTQIGDNVTIGANCTIGLPGFGYAESPTGLWRRVPHLGRVLIESHVEIGSNTCIDRGVMGDTVVHFGAKIDNLVHIAHNCEVGEFALVIANAMLAGSTKVGVRAWVAPSASTRDHITIGDAAVLGVGAVAVKDVEAGRTVVGNPAKPISRKP